jgi:hypothetical protein
MNRDRKLISSEKHEIAYVRKVAREIFYNESLKAFPDEKLLRVCKAVLKFTTERRKNRWKKKR